MFYYRNLDSKLWHRVASNFDSKRRKFKCIKENTETHSSNNILKMDRSTGTFGLKYI